MELAIPLIALGGLYIVSNQASKKKEGMAPRRSQLPNVDIPDKNYPNNFVDDDYDGNVSSELSRTNAFAAPSIYTDKYFNQEYTNPVSVSQSQSEYKSLTGDNVGIDYFTHNNMTPYFGSKSHEINSFNAGESTLDALSGAGSQNFSKREQAPMFAPTDSVQWAHGTPNNTDFIKSRMNTSQKYANTRPFEPIQVAPGLGLGGGSEGAGGFNSGMLARDLWRDPTVDELRVQSKQKASGVGILGYEGPANSKVQNRGDIGPVEKNRVDTYFEMGQDRLFTTTGIQKNAAMQPEIIDRYVSRPETTSAYSGIAGASNPAHYVKGKYMDSTNIALDSYPVNNAYAKGKGGMRDGDYDAKSAVIYKNNRVANLGAGKDNQYFGGFGSAIGAAMAPLMDVLRPSRRENVIGNLRPYQNIRGSKNSYVFDPSDRPATTIREITDTKCHPNINAQQKGAYDVVGIEISATQRDSTSRSHIGGSSAGARSREVRTYDAEYNNQRNNGLKSSVLAPYTPGGNMDLLNTSVNMTAKRRDAETPSSRAVIANRSAGTIPSFDMMGKVGESAKNYSGMSADRNNGDVLDQLKQNPYVLSVINGI